MKFIVHLLWVLPCLLFPCLPTPAGAQPDTDWQAICRQVANHPFPSNDRPTSEQAKQLKDCNSYDLYYGFYNDSDPEQARLCAYAEMDGNDDSGPFTGTMMLMTIYANGVGAQRDLDLAIRLACETGWAPAEIEGRVRHLAALKAKRWQGTDFSICDDITSGYMAGFCAGHAEKFAANERGERLDRIQARWAAAEAQAYEAFRKVADRYIEVHADNEVDTGGTARAAMYIDDKAAQEELILKTLEVLEKGALPKATNRQFREVDGRLNALYGKIQRKSDFEHGTVTREQIRTSQRVWLKYRDAWVRFCKVRYPGCTADSVRAYLTEKRIKELAEFGD